jgi:hypothetical protein
MSWETYVSTQLINQPQADGTFIENVCEHAGIISHAGAPWAYSKDFAFQEYDTEIEITDTEKRTIHVNEMANFLDSMANNGKTKKDGGIRIKGQKYMTGMYDSDTNICYLSKPGGGACIMKTHQTFLVATWNGALKDSKGIPQNKGTCNGVVEKLGTFLMASSY